MAGMGCIAFIRVVGCGENTNSWGHLYHIEHPLFDCKGQAEKAWSVWMAGVKRRAEAVWGAWSHR
jgi:hypothetical protein